MKRIRLIGKRLIAMFLDMCVIAIYALALFFLVTQVINYKGTSNVFILNMISFVCMFLPGLLYFSFMEYHFAYTIGKKVMKLKVESEKNWTRLLIRNVIKLLPWQMGHMMVYYLMSQNYEFDGMGVVYLILIYGLIIANMIHMIVSKSNQSIYDKLTSTYVKNSSF